MAITTMKNRNCYISGRYVPGWHHKETIAGGATGNDVIIPPLPAGKTVTCTLIAGANTGKFQITTSSDEDIKAGTATWQDWAKGDSTNTVTDVIIGQVTGIRGVSVSGEVKIEIVI